ncbi:MAG: uroporphyrinogen decarboxylase [Oscillospiraceae bacterium]|nr:uroporphyrinogen decarboxylase [Oscillospiraceae bacterium]
MLNPKQNFYEAVKGLAPDRFSNQYEAVRLIMNPSMFHSAYPKYGEENVKNAWGIYYSFPVGTPGAFPVHTPDKVVIKDIEHWRDYVHAPELKFAPQEWEIIKGGMAKGGDLAYKAVFVVPGLFEQCHCLGEITNTLVNLAMYEDEMHDLIKYLTDWELELAEQICENAHPNALFHHDDWGSRTSTFMSPAMFEDFFVEPYQQIYGYYKAHGVELVIHHSDSYAATLVPSMIDMGIDVWQGCMKSNNLPELVDKYCGKIAFMGGFDGADYDYEGWTKEETKEKVWKYLDLFKSPKGIIPCIAQGGPGSVYDGVYDAITEAIDEYNVAHFGIDPKEIERAPIQYEKTGYA